MSILDNDPCVRCGSLVGRFCKFCSDCGAENIHFDRIEFSIQFESSIEDFRRDTCEKGHPDMPRYLKEIGQEPGMTPDTFCFVCGNQLTSGVN
ncbi:hypothetical protein D4R51_02785 [bacterium]|nr:MAG: hypothetical protein D4R51_02785 [bacterium]